MVGDEPTGVDLVSLGEAQERSIPRPATPTGWRGDREMRDRPDQYAERSHSVDVGSGMRNGAQTDLRRQR